MFLWHLKYCISLVCSVQWLLYSQIIIQAILVIVCYLWLGVLGEQPCQVM